MEDEEKNANGKISPEKAMEMLKSEGMNVTIEEATEILLFLRKMAHIAVSKFLES
ncbi:hypothetical protein [Flavobacterium aquiphilum]|uniref:hypothetical protein n=1 Tax=Flavobacterium aquiphilum TaxID=3003261 RepID=UPI0024811E5F|nr:hypothetical protein [Flavobacterium aquiphilum]